MRFRVEVPASSANLGPGFDTFGVALGLMTSLDVTLLDDGAPVFSGGPELFGGPNLVLAGMQAIADACQQPLPGCHVQVESNIPVARGLGSSATALVAGMIAGNRLLGEPFTTEDLFQIAARMEGHGDNVSASLFGGVTLSVNVANGDIVCRQVPINGELAAVVFISDTIGLTEEARRVVPKQVSQADAVSNISRSALVVLALTGGEFEMLGEAMKDRMHQPYRAELFPHLPVMIDEAIESGAYGASLSGAGPSVLALTAPERVPAVEAAMADAAVRIGVPGRAVALDVVRDGGRILEAASIPASSSV